MNFKILNGSDQRHYRNMSALEHQAIKQLQRNTKVVIKQSDEGSCVVVMDRKLYVKEAFREIDDPLVYEKLDSDPTNVSITEITTALDGVLEDDVITTNVHRFVFPTESKPARFYLLPKLHKAGVPGRPVISGCQTPTEGIFELVDHFTQPLVPTKPSYNKDTNDFLTKNRSLGPPPPEAYWSPSTSPHFTRLYPTATD